MFLVQILESSAAESLNIKDIDLKMDPQLQDAQDAHESQTPSQGAADIPFPASCSAIEWAVE